MAAARKSRDHGFMAIPGTSLRRYRSRDASMWPDARFKMSSTRNARVLSRIIRGNGLPVNTPTGTFPVSFRDAAFQIDRNPNTIQQQNIMLTLPMNLEL